MKSLNHQLCIDITIPHKRVYPCRCRVEAGEVRWQESKIATRVLSSAETKRYRNLAMLP